MLISKNVSIATESAGAEYPVQPAMSARRTVEAG